MRPHVRSAATVRDSTQGSRGLRLPQPPPRHASHCRTRTRGQPPAENRANLEDGQLQRKSARSLRAMQATRSRAFAGNGRMSCAPVWPTSCDAAARVPRKVIRKEPLEMSRIVCLPSGVQQDRGPIRPYPGLGARRPTGVTASAVTPDPRLPHARVSGSVIAPPPPPGSGSRARERHALCYRLD